MTDNPIVLGVCGSKGAGKDTIANQLVERHGFTRVAFADALKEVALQTNPIVFAAGEYTRLVDVVNSQGWEHAKYYADVRGYLQNLGMAARENISEDVWINTVLWRIMELTQEGRNVVITDVRLTNEFNLIKDALGGHILRVDRPGHAPEDDHVTENEFKLWKVSLVWVNRGTPEHAAKCSDLIVKTLKELSSDTA
jgi:hypothetical protein